MAIDIRKPRVVIPVLLLVGLVVLVIHRLNQASAPVEPAPTVEEIRAEQGLSVTVAPAETGALAVWRELSGTVSGAQEGVVRARSGDQIARVPVQVGANVRRGDLLVVQEGEASAARVRQAEVGRRQAARTVDRLRPLHEAGAISDQEWEGALSQLELASADVAAAREALALTSPLDGVVTEVIARPGMIPASGDPLVRVADLRERVVYLRAGAAEAAELREGQVARAAGSAAAGRVRRIALQADPATRMVEVEVAFPAESGLIPGTLATVAVEVARRESALQVPRAALRDGAVWVLTGEGTVTRRPVQVGLEGVDRAEILSGLAAGERVVVEGAALLSEGARVRVVDSGTE